MMPEAEFLFQVLVIALDAPMRGQGDGACLGALFTLFRVDDVMHPLANPEMIEAIARDAIATVTSRGRRTNAPVRIGSGVTE